jgi:hypothetical protein
MAPCADWKAATQQVGNLRYGLFKDFRKSAASFAGPQ